MAGELAVLDDIPEDDGMTIEHEAEADYAARAIDIGVLPPSKLPPAQQFTVLQGYIRADMEHSREWRAEARFCYEFRAGKHWTAEDEAMLADKGRPVIVFNRVLTILKAVAGMEINGRHEVAFIPRGVEDTAVNEILSAASTWMADECDGEDEESHAFDDTITTGMGWCENRMSYDDDPAGMYVEEQVSPLEMYWDRGCKKRNLAGARRMARIRRMPLSEAVAMFPGKSREELDAVWAVDGVLDGAEKSIEDKWRRDENNTLDPSYNDLAEVTIVQIQWIERETYYLIADEATNQKFEATERQYKMLVERMKQFGLSVEAVRLQRKVYKQAFLGGQNTMLRPAGPAPLAGQFSWKCITGELNTIKGTFFGLVIIMRDPQMWANKWLSQILHILNSTAKGGIIAERTAFDDQQQAEESYAQADEITWAADGALSGPKKPKIIPKPGDSKIDGYVGLLTLAIEAIHTVPGINLELLGQKDMNQPGVLEAMRKQAGMTVLATLFDSLRRFRKQTGRARLYIIQNFLSDGRLIRVAGAEGKPQAVALAKEKTSGSYDVRVEDAPTSPNQKEANWQIIQPMLAVFKDQLLQNPRIFALILEYSPLPARIVEAIKEMIRTQEEDPQRTAEVQENRQLFIAGMMAKIAKDQSTANMNEAKAGGVKATALYDIAMAKNMMDDNLRQGKHEEAKTIAEMMKAIAQGQQAEADRVLAEVEAAARAAEVEHGRAKAERERAGIVTDVIDARSRAESERAKAGRERMGTMIDHLAGTAKADRDLAAAEKDRAVARREDRTPVKPPAKAGAK